MKKYFILLSLLNFSYASNLVCIDSFSNDGNMLDQKLIEGFNKFDEVAAKSCSNPSGYQVKGSLIQNDKDKYSIDYALYSRNSLLFKQSVEFKGQSLNLALDVIRNNIYNAIYNKNGIYQSKIALAVKDYDNKYKIIIANYDGSNPTPILISDNPISSLTWSKSGDYIAYVSYEMNKPTIYIQNIYNNSRYVVSNFNGSNSSPAFSDDGKTLYVTLSKDYGSHIYSIDNKPFNQGSNAVPFVKMGSIDTEADVRGNKLVFTSNRSGEPEVYLTDISVLNPKLISFGKYNTTPRFSNYGEMIAYIHKQRGGYSVYIYNTNTNKTIKFSNQNFCLSPTFSPDDNLLAYVSDNSVFIKSINTGKEQKIYNLTYKEVNDIRWSPL